VCLPALTAPQARASQEETAPKPATIGSLPSSSAEWLETDRQSTFSSSNCPSRPKMFTNTSASAGKARIFQRPG
jgi:hypothetical protein